MSFTSSKSRISSIWKYRSLILIISYTDFKSKYKNSSLGLVWSLLEPLLHFGILYIVFVYLLPRQIENYAIFLFTGLVLWRMFANGTAAGLQSMLSKTSIITRVALPLEIPVISSTISSLMTTAIELGALFILMAVLQFIPPVYLLFLPLLLGLEAIIVVGLSLPLSVLNVFYRDVHHMWSLIISAGFFLSGIFYDVNTLPEPLRTWSYYNPMVGIVSLGRTLLLGTPAPSYFEMIYILMVPFILLVLGYIVFRHFSQRVVEEV